MTTQVAFAYFGMVVTGVALIGLAGFALLFAAAFVVSYFPRLHVGRPKNIGELCFYDRREILTTKSGGLKEPTGRGSLLHEPLQLRWWIGLSSRNSHKWFFGFMRWQSPSPISRRDG